ncbi:unnamed protein product [Phaedon cochleariae]|uniref:Protein PTHB1 n=1 Tax=Phaedon cochleariae TaxID=80249 RepID=A0A9P0GSE2_PHACE|nr:unnamed protein product [Phaedon cochleariae]
MSLFKTREFWTVQSEDDESFDQNSCITTILNSDSDYIISGSHSGVLRVFQPSCSLTENGLSGFIPTDLLIESILESPILQVGCGRLASGSQNFQIAVLHPRVLSVYSLKTKEGVTEHGNQNVLEPLYCHDLRRSAANFTIGPFGSTQNRDFMCVQSLDGMLSFFEQENSVFSCFLPDFLLPTPIVYIKKTDSFITGNGNWKILSYKYNALSETSAKSLSTDISPKVIPEWVYNIGEAFIDISVAEDKVNKQSWVIILGERNLFCLSDRGRIKFMKRFEFSPICFETYMTDGNIYSLIISETSTLLIYQNTTVKWSTMLNFLPICIKRAFFRTVKGAMVLLSEEGRLECCYLGTEPSPFVAPPITHKEIDFETVGEELESMNALIKKSYGTDMKITNQSTEKEIKMHVTVNPNLVPCIFDTNLKDASNLQMCAIVIDLTPQVPFEELQISVAPQLPIKVQPQIQFYTNLSEKASFTCYAYLYEDYPVVSLNVEVSVTMISHLGIPRTLTTCVLLPMKLVATTCPAQKDGEHKVTLSVNKKPVVFLSLFPEFTEEASLTQTSSSIGFQLISNPEITGTILQAKSSERYRVQANSLASLALLIEQLIFRLCRQYSGTEDFKVRLDSSLHANELILYVDRHFEKRQLVSKLEEDLAQLSAQFRIVQKRLIAKLRVKNPSPLTNLQILLKDTHSEIVDVTEKLEVANSELSRAQSSLSCALNLVVNLVKVMDMDENSKGVLESVFSPNVQDLESQNWEDVMDSSLCYLLRTSLAKSEKDKLRIAQTSYEEVKDTSKLGKHLVQVLERISKLENKTEIVVEDTMETLEESDNDNEEKPIGSQFGEASSRLLSARRSLLKNRQKQ